MIEINADEYVLVPKRVADVVLKSRVPDNLEYLYEIYTIEAKLLADSCFREGIKYANFYNSSNVPQEQIDIASKYFTDRTLKLKP